MYCHPQTVSLYHNSSVWLDMSSARTVCDSWSIFKRNLTDINSDFSFFSSGCHTTVKKPCLSSNFFRTGGRIVRFMLPQGY